MATFDYKSYGNTINPQNLVIFLHGYKSSMEDISPEAALLSSLSPQTLVITPQSPKIHQKNKMRYWYNVAEFDTEHKRHNPQTPLEEIVQIYNAAGEQLAHDATQINRFINEIIQQYHVPEQKTFIAGFSQGAMLALYTALSRGSNLGGCFVISGLVAGKDKLEQELNSYPKIYLFHGLKDDVILPKTIDFTTSWLKEHNIDFKLETFENLAHKIDNQELAKITAIINNTVYE